LNFLAGQDQGWGPLRNIGSQEPEKLVFKSLAKSPLVWRATTRQENPNALCIPDREKSGHFYESLSKSRLWSLAAFDGLLMSIAKQSRSQKKLAGGGERRFKCPECEKYFSRNAYIQVLSIGLMTSEYCCQRHLRTVHGGEREFQCPECQQRFGQKSKMTVLIYC
jgi:hypothetical protein